jgi:hypothetical protein
MGMKQPRGMAKPIEGAVSKPKDVTCYEGVGNGITKPKPTGNENVGNSSTPDPKDTGTPKIY